MLDLWCLVSTDDLDGLAKLVEESAARRIAASSAQNQFGRDLKQLIRRHNMENHLSYAEVVGVLALQQAILTDQFILEGYDDDDDEEEEECPY